MAHTFANKTGEQITFKAIYKPALNIDYFLVESFETMNSAPNPKKATWQNMVDFDFILKQVPGEYKLAGVPVFILSLFGAVGKLFAKPKVLSLQDFRNRGKD